MLAKINTALSRARSNGRDIDPDIVAAILSVDEGALDALPIAGLNTPLTINLAANGGKAARAFELVRPLATTENIRPDVKGVILVVKRVTVYEVSNVNGAGSLVSDTTTTVSTESFEFSSGATELRASFIPGVDSVSSAEAKPQGLESVTSCALDSGKLQITQTQYEWSVSITAGWIAGTQVSGVTDDWSDVDAE